MDASKLNLRGDRIVLTEFGEEHLASTEYRSWLRDPRVVTPIYRMEYLMPLRFESVVDHVRSLMGSANDALFAIQLAESGEFIGTLKLGHIDWRASSADLGILIGRKDLWGKGLSKDCVATAVRYAFEVLGLRRVSAGTPSGNEAMRRCFLKVGFSEEGRLRESLKIGTGFQDHILFGILSREHIHTDSNGTSP